MLTTVIVYYLSRFLISGSARIAMSSLITWFRSISSGKTEKDGYYFYMSVHPSVCLSGTTWLSEVKFSWSFTSGIFTKICRPNWSLVKNGKTKFTRKLRSSGLLRSELWYFLTDVSEQPIGAILKSQESLKMGSIGCAEISVRNYS